MQETEDTTPAEKWCLFCDKAGHQSDECWSTYGNNTPRSNELLRLVTTIATLRAEVDTLRAELKLCGKDNCMGRRVKGVTQWVTEQAKDAAVAEVRAEVEGLRAVLQRILDEPKQTMSDAKALREIVRMARAAIDAAKAAKA